MANRSSTSNFSAASPQTAKPAIFATGAKLPLAGLLALAIVLVVDWLVLGVHGPWQALRPRVEGALPRGVVADRLALRRLVDTPEAQPRAIVVGSSRANAGFLPGLIPAELRDVTFGKIAHAGIGAFEMRSLVDEVVALDIDAMVLVLSEFDLNRPVNPTLSASFRSFSAIRDLVAEAGIAACFERRVIVYRLIAAALLDSYRFRAVLHSAFADDLRRFELDDRFPGGGVPGNRTVLVAGGERRPLRRGEGARIRTRIGQTFPHLSAAAVRIVFGQVHSITRGPHAEVQAGLVRRAVRRLSEAGVEVVIAEAPVHPLATEVYDSTIRTEFLALASSLEEDYGIGFIPIESSGPFSPEEFRDLTHLDHSGAGKLTAAIATAVHEVLRQPAGSAQSM